MVAWWWWWASAESLPVQMVEILSKRGLDVLDSLHYPLTECRYVRDRQ